MKKESMKTTIVLNPTLEEYKEYMEVKNEEKGEN